MNVLARAALVGAATGLRTSAGLGILIEAGEPGLPQALRTQQARTAAAIGIVSELVIDKLPATPSRLEARGLFGRLAAAAAAGTFVARGADEPLTRPALVATVSALVAAKIGHDVRVAHPSLLVAAAEDSIALSLASNGS